MQTRRSFFGWLGGAFAAGFAALAGVQRTPSAGGLTFEKLRASADELDRWKGETVYPLFYDEDPVLLYQEAYARAAARRIDEEIMRAGGFV